MFKIDRNKSNKIVKTIKTLAFVGLLTLTFPNTSNANQIVQEEKIEQFDLPAKLAVGSYASAIAITLGLALIYKIDQDKEKQNNRYNVYNLKDDGNRKLENAKKYVKIVNR